MVDLKELVRSNDLVKRAYEFAHRVHRGQKRKNGEPTLNHALAVAETIAELGLDELTVALGLIHDTVKESKIPQASLEAEFGAELTDAVFRITKIGSIKYRGTEMNIENLQRFILYLAREAPVILVKLASRLHNLKTLYAMPVPTQKRVALETMEVYAPLAYQLGIYKLAGELEDLAFPYVYPDEHKSLMTMVKDLYEERENYVERLKPTLETALAEHDVEVVRTLSRAKHYYSLYRKLLRYEMNLDQIYDLVAFRVIVRTVADCYNVLGIVHNLWRPLPGRLKDYVASPKSNGYRSIHTTVETPGGKSTEIQIRTELMDYEAELGIAAHYAYRGSKETGAYLARTAARTDPDERTWLTQVRDWEKSFADVDFFKNRILALTPKGDVIALPIGSTTVDFAYHIHTEVGNRCAGALVNSRIAPLDRTLETGDVVEIITKKTKRPSAAWLEFVKSAHARSQIRASLRGAPTGVSFSEPTVTEVRIAAVRSDGLVKTISEAITGLHLELKSIRTQPASAKGVTQVRINCGFIPVEKAEKLAARLEKIEAVKRFEFRNS